MRQIIVACRFLQCMSHQIFRNGQMDTSKTPEYAGRVVREAEAGKHHPSRNRSHKSDYNEKLFINL